MSILALSAMLPGQEADMFLVMTSKEQLTTREGKPYYRVGFRDGGREVVFPIWDNSPWAAECRENGRPGTFYKIRAVYRETNYGPQMDIRKIREVCDADAADGFDPTICLPQSRYDPQRMFEELLVIVPRADYRRGPAGLGREDTGGQSRRAAADPAARHNHHAFVAGWLEHTLSVTRTAIYLADKYAEYYDETRAAVGQVDGRGRRDPARYRQASRVGAAARRNGLHGQRGVDRPPAAGPRHGARDGDRHVPCPRDTLLRLEHLIIAHQRLPEWGSPKPPMTPEALFVHYADDMDAKFAHDGRGPAERYERRAGDVEEECPDATSL